MDKEYFASINDVSRELELPAYTLRYWEKQFPTVVRPVTGAGGRRYYRAETVARLKAIKDLLYNRGLTIAGVKKMIHDGKFLSTAESGAYTESTTEKKSTESVTETFDFDEISIDDIVTPKMPAQKPIPEPIVGAASFDATKVDLTIGLLTQASELLKQ